MQGVRKFQRVDGQYVAIPINTIPGYLKAIKKYTRNYVRTGALVSESSATDCINVSAGEVTQNGFPIVVPSFADYSLGTGSRGKRVVVYVPSTANGSEATVAFTAVSSTIQPTVPAGAIPLAFVKRVAETSNKTANAKIDNDARPKVFEPIKQIAYGS